MSRWVPSPSEYFVEFTGDKDCSSSQSYVWSVDNKYYSAKILLSHCHLDENCKVNVEAGSYEAVVIVTDNHFSKVRNTLALN